LSFKNFFKKWVDNGRTICYYTDVAREKHKTQTTKIFQKFCPTIGRIEKENVTMDMNATMIKISVADYMNFVDEAWKAASLEAERDTLKARIADLEKERDEWFTKYQVLKERTDNYDFLVYKTREQEKEIYRLVKEINELGV